jgi:hypothetical protein
VIHTSSDDSASPFIIPKEIPFFNTENNTTYLLRQIITSQSAYVNFYCTHHLCKCFPHKHRINFCISREGPLPLSVEYYPTIFNTELSWTFLAFTP